MTLTELDEMVEKWDRLIELGEDLPVKTAYRHVMALVVEVRRLREELEDERINYR